jgi:signal transduction histidine kinase
MASKKPTGSSNNEPMNPPLLKKLRQLLMENEEWLMARILHYAKRNDYTRYTSTLLEPWRLSIAGLTDSFIAAAQAFGEVPELGPDEEYTTDPVASFGVIEARKHRKRGITLPMFLGLMKYYRQSYLDLLEERTLETEKLVFYQAFLTRCFDRIELGFCSEWAALSNKVRLDDLQGENRQLANLKNKYLTVFESLKEPAILLDSAHRIRNANSEAQTLLAGTIRPGASYYRPDGSVELSETPPDWLLDEVYELVTQGEDQRRTERSLDTREGRRYYEIRLQKMLDISEKFAGTVVVLTDITHRKQLEQAQKLESVGQLAAGLAHEINTPIQYIADNTSFFEQSFSRVDSIVERLLQLKEEIEAADSDGRFADSCQAIDRLLKRSRLSYLRKEVPVAMRQTLDGLSQVAGIVRALKSFAQDGDDIESLVDLTQAIHNTVAVARGQWASVASVDVVLDEGAKLVPGSESQINQALLNVVVNAAQAIAERDGKEKGIIRISTRSDQEWVEIRVSDNGVGIAEENLGRIFDPFFTTKDVGRGTGQGLAIVHTVVTRHNGQIDIESEQGIGTTFIIRLPRMIKPEKPVKQTASEPALRLVQTS